MKKIALLLAIFAIGLQSVLAQTKQITGKVTSADDGSSLPGVSVSVKGTTLGTITDLDGNYSLKVPNDVKTLIFSFVGMQTLEVAVSGTTVNAVMKSDVVGINEVVVSALGITREKKTLGTATQTVAGDEIQKAGSPNVINSLAGKVAGVQITQAGGQLGSSSRIVIRGNSSFGDNQPLIVVDGVPVSNANISNNAVDYGSGLNDINPQDIENISVLKGGTAAALYGMRAGHGVILITTKSGKGNAKGVSVTYDGSFNFDQVYGIQKLQNKYGQGEYGDEFYFKKYGAGMTYQEYATGGYDPGMGFTYVDGIGNGVNDGVDESWGPRMDIGLKIAQYNSPLDSNGDRIPTAWISHPNNVKDLFRIGHTTAHNISLASVTDHSTTRLSVGLRDQAGTLPNTDLKRYNIGVNSRMTLNDYIDFDVAANYARTASDNLPLTEYNASNPMQSLGQWFGRQVDMKDLKANWKKTLDNGFPYNWNSNYHNNPYWSLNNNTNSMQKDRFFGKASMFVKPTSFITVEGRVGLDYYNSKNNRVVYSGSNETLLDASTASFHGGWFRLNQENRTELNADLIASIVKKFDKISFDAMAGANYRNLRWESSTLGADQLTVPNLFTISNVSGSPVTAMDHSWVRSNSVYASASLGYDGWIYLSSTVRNDWSSTIADSFFYPSFSASFLPFEAFKIESDAISFLKLRGGWAKVGSATGAYQTDPYFSASSSTIKGVTQYSQTTTFPTANIRPEQVTTTELGLEANFLKNRVGIDLSYYDKTTTDQIMNVSLSYATGYANTLINAGEINNKGFEVQLNATVIKDPEGFSWDVVLNWATDKSKIIELYTDPVTGQKLESYDIGSQWSTYVQARPGDEWGVIYGTGMVRDDNGAIIVGASGRPTLKSGMKLGSVTPDWIGGIRNEFTYKNWSAGFLIDIRKGGDIFSISNMFGAYGGQLAFTAEGDLRENGVILGKNYMTDEKFVKADGSVNDITTSAQNFFQSFYSNRELSVYDGSYGKLREAHLTYNLPKGFLGTGSMIKGGSVSLIGTNLATLWLDSSNKAKIDPENSVGSGNGGVGLETTSFPPSRSFGVKLSLKF